MLLFSNMAHCALSAISPWSPHLKLMDEIWKKSLHLMHGWSGRKGQEIPRGQNKKEKILLAEGGRNLGLVMGLFSWSRVAESGSLQAPRAQTEKTWARAGGRWNQIFPLHADSLDSRAVTSSLMDQRKKIFPEERFDKELIKLSAGFSLRVRQVGETKPLREFLTTKPHTQGFVKRIHATDQWNKEPEPRS